MDRDAFFLVADGFAVDFLAVGILPPAFRTAAFFAAFFFAGFAAFLRACFAGAAGASDSSLCVAPVHSQLALPRDGLDARHILLQLAQLLHALGLTQLHLKAQTE